MVQKIVGSFIEHGLEVSEAHICEDNLKEYFKRITGGERKEGTVSCATGIIQLHNKASTRISSHEANINSLVMGFVGIVASLLRFQKEEVQ